MTRAAATQSTSQPGGVFNATELVCVGDELLDGRTQDRNAHWLGGHLRRMGHALAAVSFVSDDVDHIVAALANAQQRYVLVSGGLGPTEDDRTRHAAARFSGADLREEPAVLATLRQRYAARGRSFPEANRRQALFPKGTEILATEVGTAPGFRLRHTDRIYDFVPGVPYEFRWFVKSHWLPLLEPAATESHQQRWRLFGLGESEIADLLEGIHALHYTVRFPEVHVFAVRAGLDGHSQLSELNRLIERRLGQWLIGVGEASLAERVGGLLLQRGWRLAAAESCTGGQVCQTLTAAAGASAYFEKGWVTYSNASKVEQLGVSPQTLQRYGAVSPQTADEMARGARDRANADIGVAVTGIAGPTGGSKPKPVGTVHLALSTAEQRFHRHLRVPLQSRKAIRTWSTWAALTGVLWYLLDRLPEQDWERVH